jgi:hypothetical protein
VEEDRVATLSKINCMVCREVASTELCKTGQLSICFMDGTILTVESKDGSELELSTSNVALGE